MKTFSDLTGGMHFMPRFTGDFPDDVKAINDNIRAKYELVYRPINSKQDGTYRKLRVALVDDEGHPLRIQDEKHKPLNTRSSHATGTARSRKWNSEDSCEAGG